ncbi:MAG: KilA-N domain-containing protein [gamma proteobacterium symbiont of Taylorina sp.]|nr:KilA-N domain-containing protein [gamma proteobacterium symbiont of Taylorina sp.]
MSTKFEIVEVNNKEIMVDVSMLVKSDTLFFNATKMAKQFNKRPDDFWKQPQNIEYLEALITLGEGNKKSDFIKTKKGKYGGTWFHNDLALQFARWLNSMFAVKLDKWIIQRLKDEHNRQQKRLESKTGFLQLSQAVEGSHDPVEFYHYTTETNMINKIVLGMDAKKYKKLHRVDNVRDNCNTFELSQIDELQKADACLIKMGISYHDRKSQLENYYAKSLQIS